MADPIVFDPADSLAAGAIGDPGSRVFMIQAEKGAARLTVAVEKEQMALLAMESVAFLERLEADHPAWSSDLADSGAPAVALEPAEPLFRARLIGLGFEPERKLVLIELRERSADPGGDAPALGDGPLPWELPSTDGAVSSGGGDDEHEAESGGDGGDSDYGGAEAGSGTAVVRLYVTPAQVRAMAATAVEAVARGRRRCPLCDQPMDPQGHRCPRWN